MGVGCSAEITKFGNSTGGWLLNAVNGLGATEVAHFMLFEFQSRKREREKKAERKCLVESAPALIRSGLDCSWPESVWSL